MPLKAVGRRFLSLALLSSAIVRAEQFVLGAMTAYVEHERTPCASEWIDCPTKREGRLQHFKPVDILNDSHNCGGCTSTSHGIVCHAIPGTTFATCDQGKCQAHSCKDGWHINRNEWEGQIECVPFAMNLRKRRR